MSEHTSYQIAQRQMRYSILARNPEIQSEAIANHYASLAVMAIELKKLIELEVRFGTSEQLVGTIKHLTEDIKRRHLNDFGIPLEWQMREAAQ